MDRRSNHRTVNQRTRGSRPPGARLVGSTDAARASGQRGRRPAPAARRRRARDRRGLPGPRHGALDDDPAAVRRAARPRLRAHPRRQGMGRATPGRCSRSPTPRPTPTSAPWTSRCARTSRPKSATTSSRGLGAAASGRVRCGLRAGGHSTCSGSQRIEWQAEVGNDGVPPDGRGGRFRRRGHLPATPRAPRRRASTAGSARCCQVSSGEGRPSPTIDVLQVERSACCDHGPSTTWTSCSARSPTRRSGTTPATSTTPQPTPRGS